MIKFTHGIKEIKRDFLSHGIPVDSPGFYDHEAFLRIERINPDYLNNYARFVSRQNYDVEYLQRARTVIPVVAEALHSELLRDGRQGACVDTSGVLSKVLEREGFWNYVVKGSLTMDFPASSGIERQHFWTIDHGEFVAAHAWVCAPPFSVIDLTIRQQGNTSEEHALLPDIVLAENPQPYAPTIEDVIAPDIRAHLRSRGVPPSKFFHVADPTLEPFFRAFSSWKLTVGQMVLKYVPAAVSAPDSPLEGMVGLSGNGRDGAAIYEEVIVPALKRLRNKG